jgi:hypothetical protein
MSAAPAQSPRTGHFTPEWVEVLRKIETQSTPELLAIAVIAAEASERSSAAHAAAFAGDTSVAMPRAPTLDPYTGHYPHEWAAVLRMADPMVCPASTHEILAAAIALADAANAAAAADAAAATMPSPPTGGLERLPSLMGVPPPPPPSAPLTFMRSSMAVSPAVKPRAPSGFTPEELYAAVMSCPPPPPPTAQPSSLRTKGAYLSRGGSGGRDESTFVGFASTSLPSAPPSENHHLRTLTREGATVSNCPPPSAAMPCPLVRTASCECAVLECPPPSNKWSGVTPVGPF